VLRICVNSKWSEGECEWGIKVLSICEREVRLGLKSRLVMARLLRFGGDGLDFKGRLSLSFIRRYVIHFGSDTIVKNGEKNRDHTSNASRQV
jgi:hypothetical protein